jgi:hypothetical protein
LQSGDQLFLGWWIPTSSRHGLRGLCRFLGESHAWIQRILRCQSYFRTQFQTLEFHVRNIRCLYAIDTVPIRFFGPRHRREDVVLECRHSHKRLSISNQTSHDRPLPLRWDFDWSWIWRP